MDGIKMLMASRQADVNPFREMLKQMGAFGGPLPEDAVGLPARPPGAMPQQGQAALGNLVRKLIAQGMPKEEAMAQAEQMLSQQRQQKLSGGHISLSSAASRAASRQLAVPGLVLPAAQNFLQPSPGPGPDSDGLPGQVLVSAGVGNPPVWTTARFEQPFSSITSVIVTHNFGAYPIVQVLDNTASIMIPMQVKHTSVNAFLVAFSIPTSGLIIAGLY